MNFIFKNFFIPIFVPPVADLGDFVESCVRAHGKVGPGNIVGNGGWQHDLDNSIKNPYQKLSRRGLEGQPGGELPGGPVVHQ